MSANVSLFHSVEVGNGTSFRPWHLADISKDGARLRVDAAGDVPDRFTLLVKGEVMKLLKCRVVAVDVARGRDVRAVGGWRAHQRLIVGCVHRRVIGY
jgi:hypothetical protein